MNNRSNQRNWFPKLDHWFLRMDHQAQMKQKYFLIFGFIPAHFVWTQVWHLIHWIISSSFVSSHIIQNQEVIFCTPCILWPAFGGFVLLIFLSLLNECGKQYFSATSKASFRISRMVKPKKAFLSWRICLERIFSMCMENVGCLPKAFTSFPIAFFLSACLLIVALAHDRYGYTHSNQYHHSYKLQQSLINLFRTNVHNKTPIKK